jgi:hypothetical protein
MLVLNLVEGVLRTTFGLIVIPTPSAWIWTYDSAKDPYDEAFKAVESQGVSTFMYDIVAPEGAHNNVYSACHPEKG